MRDRLRRRLNRAKYAAIGAAIGAALGGLVSREAAGTVAGIGALAGANVGESRALLTYEEFKRKNVSGDSFSDTEQWFADAFADLFGGGGK
jgi:osmotically inducible lipoprotein OsmB